jgi:hypothetical protein
MLTVSIYLLKYQRLDIFKANNCWGVDIDNTDEYTLSNHFEVSDPDYTEPAIPMNGRERNLTYEELEKKYDWFHATMIKGTSRRPDIHYGQEWEFYIIPIKEGSDALMLLMNIVHGFEPETLALLYVNHPYLVIQDVARNIIQYGKDSVHFVYNTGIKDMEEVKKHFKVVKDKE